MNIFISFVRKETWHILRDKRTMLILFGMPVVMMLIFGFAITTDVKDVRTVVVTSQMDTQTQRAVEKLSQSEYFTIIQTVPTPKEAELLIRNQKADMCLIPGPSQKEGGDNMLGSSGGREMMLMVDGADPNMAQQWVNYAKNSLTTNSLTTNSLTTAPSPRGEGSELSSGIDMVSGKKSTNCSLPTSILAPLSFGEGSGVRLLYNPSMRSAYNFVPAILGMLLMLVCAMMTSISIVREKERGTMEVLLVSPVQPMMIIIAKVVPYLGLAFAILTTILLMARYVLDVPLAGSIVWIYIVSTIYIILALSLGLLISNIATTQLMALLLSAMVLLVPIVMLSGMMFPVESMPEILQWIAAAVPPRYYIQAMRKLMIMGVDVSNVVREIVILSAMSLFFLLVALKMFKKRLE